MGSCPQCCIPGPMANGPSVPEKKNFKGAYHIWAWWPSWSCDLDPRTNFRSANPWRLHMQFCFNRPCGFEEIVWKCWSNWQCQPAYTFSSPISLKAQWVNKLVTVLQESHKNNGNVLYILNLSWNFAIPSMNLGHTKMLRHGQKFCRGFSFSSSLEDWFWASQA